jgi:two-component system, NtrC family, response regulator AtoC
MNSNNTLDSLPIINTLHILLVDDEEELRANMLNLLKQILPQYQLIFYEASTGYQALEYIHQQKMDLVLMDVKMPEMDGLTALEQIKTLQPECFVLIQTAHANITDAIQAIKEGAYDYIEKPLEKNKLETILAQYLKTRELVENLSLFNPIMDDDIESDLIDYSNKMKDISNLIHKLSKVDTPVLIRGESGTGKELVARAIHSNSPKKNAPFIVVNCSSLTEDSLEKEFFGYEKNAFPEAHQRHLGYLQQAHNGTLFLDEIGALTLEFQSKLLRVLEEKVFTPLGSRREIRTHTRFIVATHRNLEKMIQSGSFREDLFYRINVLPLFIPPLRERREDLPRLIHHFLQKFKKQHQGSPVNTITEEALKTMMEYSWPGNMRELENILERAFILESQQSISLENLPDFLTKTVSQKNPKDLSSLSPSSPSSPLSLLSQINKETHNSHENSSQRPSQTSSKINTKAEILLDYDSFKEQSEKDFIINALNANQGRINQTVANAGIPKNTLLRKMRKYGIQSKS